MKLYYANGACSLSCHIIAYEADIDLEAIRVDLKTKTTEKGEDFNKLTPKGYVPLLILDDGRTVSEAPAVLQYLADLKPEKNLAYAYGSFERTKVQEWLNYIATELHKNFGPLFHGADSEDEKQAAINTLFHRLELAEKTLSDNDYLVGDHFSVADSYLFVVLRWFNAFKIDLNEKFPSLVKFVNRVKEKDSVKKALAAEKA